MASIFVKRPKQSTVLFKNRNSKSIDWMRESAINEFEIDYWRKENETAKLIFRSFYQTKNRLLKSLSFKLLKSCVDFIAR